MTPSSATVWEERPLLLDRLGLRPPSLGALRLERGSGTGARGWGCLPQATHHVELSGCPALPLPRVEGAVMARGLLPGAMQVVGHEADEVQAPVGTWEGDRPVSRWDSLFIPLPTPRHKAAPGGPSG